MNESCDLLEIIKRMNAAMKRSEDISSSILRIVAKIEGIEELIKEENNG